VVENLVGGPDLQSDETNAIAVLTVLNGGEAGAFVVQDPGGKNTIDLSQIYVFATIPGDMSLADSFYCWTV
jgi:hypothetical protein